MEVMIREGCHDVCSLESQMTNEVELLEKIVRVPNSAFMNSE